MKTLEEFYKEYTLDIKEVLQNQELIIENQAEILEKLDNLSRPGSDYSVDEG